MSITTTTICHDDDCDNGEGNDDDYDNVEGDDDDDQTHEEER